MAKQKGPVTHSGKLGDVVYTDGKYGKNARKDAHLTEKQKKEKADLPQNRRTAILNGLASGLNTAVDYYGGALRSGKFYSAIHSLFRKEKSNHRVLLLDMLKNEEVHPKYTFNKLCPLPVTDLKISKTNYTVEVEMKDPAYKYGDVNCFYLQFILFVWNSEDNNCRHAAESTPWVDMKDKTAKYTTVKFKRTPKDTEYLLACRCVLGVNQTPGYFTETGMRFLLPGSVTIEGKRLLEEKRAGIEAARAQVPEKKIVTEKPRLKWREKK